MTLRWRPIRFAAFLVAYWLVGSVAITGIVLMAAAGSPYALYAYFAWAAAFAAGTYFAWSFALNRTTIRVESGRLVVRSGPLRWGWTANTATSVRDITEVAVDSHMTGGFLSPGGRLYGVSVATIDGKTIPIVACALIGAGERNDAEELARRIEGMIWASG